MAGTDVHLRDKWGYTALHWAASRGHEAVTALLLSKKVRPLPDSLPIAQRRRANVVVTWAGISFRRLASGWDPPGLLNAVAHAIMIFGTAPRQHHHVRAMAALARWIHTAWGTG